MSLHDELTTDLADIFSLNDFGKKAVYIPNVTALPTGNLDFWWSSKGGITSDGLNQSGNPWPSNTITKWRAPDNIVSPTLEQFLEADLPDWISYGSDLTKNATFNAGPLGASISSSAGGIYSNGFTIFFVARINNSLDRGMFYSRGLFDTGPFLQFPSIYSYLLWLDASNQRLTLTVSQNGSRVDFFGANGTFLDSESVRLITVRWVNNGFAIMRINQTQIFSLSSGTGSLQAGNWRLRFGALGYSGDTQFSPDTGQFQNMQMFDAVGYSVALSDTGLSNAENYLLANSPGFAQSAPINIHFVNEFDAALLDPNNAEASKPFALCKTANIPNVSHASELIIDQMTYSVVGVQPYTSHITKLILSQNTD